jgi:dipeptide/tripeptide permease
MLIDNNYSKDETSAEDLASIIYHVFTMTGYVMALFGAFLADSFIGKYR